MQYGKNILWNAIFFICIHKALSNETSTIRIAIPIQLLLARNHLQPGPSTVSHTPLGSRTIFLKSHFSLAEYETCFTEDGHKKVESSGQLFITSYCGLKHVYLCQFFRLCHTSSVLTCCLDSYSTYNTHTTTYTPGSGAL